MKLKLTYASAVAMALLFLGSCTEMGINPTSDQVRNSLVTPEQTTEAGQLIPGKYIVVFKEDVNLRGKSNEIRTKALGKMSAQGLAKSNLGFVYAHALQGFSVSMGAAAAARLAKDPDVAYVEQDQVATLSQKSKPGGGGTSPAQTTPWGITKVKGGGSNYTGTNVAWVLDTGIDLDHPDLNVDRSKSKDFTGSAVGADDQNGHGTHVAGTIAAINNTIGVIGVAPGAKVVAVKVLNRRGSGTYSGIIAGVDYVGQVGLAGDVANMSLGGGYSEVLNSAVSNASVNVKFALAAGNEATNASTKSPASANGVNIYTISAHDNNDEFATFSNFGNPPVDWCAPGVSIQSTWLNGGYNTISGTSMATPHVAGILLLGNITSRDYVISDPDGYPDKLASR